MNHLSLAKTTPFKKQYQNYNAHEQIKDLIGSGSSSYGDSGGKTGSCFSIDICPDLILAAIAAAAAGAAFVIYQAITARGKKRRKRKTDEEWFTSFVPQILILGLEEFEEKIDKISEHQGREDSWLTKMFNMFNDKYGKDDPLSANDLDGIDPPVLDETWGLSLQTSGKKNNTTIEEPISLKHEEKSKILEDNCRVELWRCLSLVIENSLHYMDNSEGYIGLIKKTFFKMAFHGSRSNVWNGVMSIPEARDLQKCLNKNEQCVSYEAIRKEAINSLDPKDDDYKRLLSFGKNETNVNNNSIKKIRRRRMIINPEFVEALDKSDGRKENDEDIE